MNRNGSWFRNDHIAVSVSATDWVQATWVSEKVVLALADREDHKAGQEEALCRPKSP